MALQYSFHISTDLAPDQLMRVMLLALGVPWKPDDEGVVYAPNFSAEVGPSRGRSREIRREQFGFDPDQYFVFRTWADAADEAEHDIVRGTLAICKAVAGDAILLFNGETVLFMRKAGKLYVNSEWWKGDYALFEPPYEVQAFSVL